MQTMKAVRIHAYGGPEVLVYEDAPVPLVGFGEALVKVRAAAVNPVDWKIREGRLAAKLHHSLPLVLGWDMSGVIEAVGGGIAGLKEGDEVYSRPDIARDGSYAEYIVVAEHEVALKPKSIDYIHAAAIPLAGMTAWQSLFDAVNLTAGQRVLIHAGAGGVGTLAVQLAKWKGAYVISTASARNLELVRSLGADEVIDYQAQSFEEVAHPVDVVLDTIGGEIQERSWRVLKRNGVLVSITDPPDQETAFQHGVRSAYVFMQPKSVVLDEMANLVDSGQLKAVIDTVLPLADARRAHELSQSGHSRGKIVLTVP